jgi:hypothetical protein
MTMTEQEWVGGTEAEKMLAFLRSNGEASERKLRLFACACCRQAWHLLKNESSQRALEGGERFADKLVSLGSAGSIPVSGTFRGEDSRRAVGLAPLLAPVTPHRSGWNSGDQRAERESDSGAHHIVRGRVAVSATAENGRSRNVLVVTWPNGRSTGCS